MTSNTPSNTISNKIPKIKTDEYAYELRVPIERIAVIIGKEGKIKRELEKNTGISIEIDSTEGIVKLQGTEALALYATREIVRAIARGFNPEIAQNLLKQDYGFELINLTEHSSTPNEMLRLKGRVIGQEGKSRRTIEQLTETNICVYGKTIGIIGQVEDIITAKKAIEMLLEGSRHGNVYKWLEKRRREQRQQEATARE